MTDQPTHNNCNNDAIKRRRSPLTARPQAPLSLVVLATLAVGYTLWATQAVILPVLLAVFFALVGNPILRALGHIRIPRAIGALLLLCLGISGTVVLSVELAGPASEWIQQAPDKIRQVARQVRHLTRPMQQANQAVESLARAADGETERQSQTVRTRLYNPYTLLMDTHKLVISVLGVILLTFFFMVLGEAATQSDCTAPKPSSTTFHRLNPTQPGTRDLTLCTDYQRDKRPRRLDIQRFTVATKHSATRSTAMGHSGCPT